MRKSHGIIHIVVASVVITAIFLSGPARGEMKGDMEKEMMGDRMGTLSGIEGHNAAGKVLVTVGDDGNHILKMTDIKVDRVPDGIVYLGRDGDHTKGLELGKLTEFKGTVSFTIPAGTKIEDYDSVVIWCRKFDVGIGRAFFEMHK